MHDDEGIRAIEVPQVELRGEDDPLFSDLGPSDRHKLREPLPVLSMRVERKSQSRAFERAERQRCDKAHKHD
jgi:hypothetical protein